MTTPLYNKIFAHITHILPTIRLTQRRNLAILMTALFLTKTPYTNRLASQVRGRAKKLSKAERLRRFLDNGFVKPAEWYESTARTLLETASQYGTIYLLIDATKVSCNYQLIMVALAFKKRALPIAWSWSKWSKGHSSAKKQIELLRQVEAFVPVNTRVILLGDSEFGSVESIKQLEKWGWKYILRQKGSVKVKGAGRWQKFRDLIAEGERPIFVRGQFTQKHQWTTNLIAKWVKGEKSPLLLTTNLPTIQAVRLYRKRMWIEEMFGDFKANGMDLEKSRLRNEARLSRLTMAVSFLYILLIAFGTKVVKKGLRHLIDRKEKRQLSIFRIGFDMIQRHLTNEESFRLNPRPYFS